MGLASSSIQSTYHHLVFHPPRPSYTKTAVTMIDEGTIKALALRWMPCTNASATIIYSHGNATDLGQCTQSIRHMGLSQQCNVLLWDYPGYGHSAGSPSEYTISQAALRMFQYYQTHWAQGEKVILMGYSLGSGPTCYLASELSKAGVSYGGVVLEAPLSSILATVLPQMVASSSASVDMFTNYWRVLSIDHPVYILHGVQDSVIPWTASQTLARKLGENLWALRLIPGANHNNLQRLDNQYDIHLMRFIAHVNNQ